MRVHGYKRHDGMTMVYAPYLHERCIRRLPPGGQTFADHPCLRHKMLGLQEQNRNVAAECLQHSDSREWLGSGFERRQKQFPGGVWTWCLRLSEVGVRECLEVVLESLQPQIATRGVSSV